jgi:hypothetical protein
MIVRKHQGLHKILLKKVLQGGHICGLLLPFCNAIAGRDFLMGVTQPGKGFCWAYVQGCCGDLERGRRVRRVRAQQLTKCYKHRICKMLSFDAL